MNENAANKVDELGRIVLPENICQKLQIQGGDSLEFFVDGDKILLKKTETSC